jgi:HlyD family secretion protein
MGDFSLNLQRAVPAGVRVKKGDPIAEFDRQYMLLRLDDYRAQLDQQAAALLSLRANLEVEKKAHRQSIEVAKATLDKARYDLKTTPVLSAIASEQLKLAEEEAAAQYKQLQSEVKNKEVSQEAQWKISALEHDQNKIEFQRSQANADRMLFRAPIDGLVVMGVTFRGSEFSQIRAGDDVRPGMMFMRVVDPSSMVVEAVVNQADIEQLRIGARARVRFDAYPDLELPGRVHSIAAMPKSGGARAAYVKEVPVVIKMERLDPRVVPDLSVSVDVVLAVEPDAVIAPLEGIFTGPPGAAPFVFVRTDSGWERRPVELGLTNNVAAVVRSGLRPGEVIAAERPSVEQKK